MSQGAGEVQERRALLLSVLSDVGYSEAHVQCDWQVSDHDELRRWREDDDPQSWPDGSPSRLDVVAFYDEREHNWDTTALVAELDRLDLTQNKESGFARARQLFELTAAPCTLFAGNGTADLWLKCWQCPELIRDIPFDQASLRSRFRQHRRDLEREALARLRGGQRYLFDGVYHARREELVQFLHRGLSKATWLGDVLPKKGSEKEYEEERRAFFRVAIALLAARILEDKGFFGTSGQTTNAREILANAEHAANGFFQQVVSEDLGRLDKRLKTHRVNGMLECLMAHLTGPASFSMVPPESLGYLYETALTAERRRGKDVELNGIHYTPRSVAQHIVDRIPVEELRPSERLVADIACGSGSFLLAATERLRDVFDAREHDAEASVLDHL
ncbi:MAG TPA: N-6 DNA methylase [Thermoguttaceae bacterium]|nr:N-6 DNA methylase [Thermoguttaceae bacterium]